TRRNGQPITVAKITRCRNLLSVGRITSQRVAAKQRHFPSLTGDGWHWQTRQPPLPSGLCFTDGRDGTVSVKKPGSADRHLDCYIALILQPQVIPVPANPPLDLL
ncbi:hypothetical protein J6590_104323, partial [Homalodisca vitripennis]